MIVNLMDFGFQCGQVYMNYKNVYRRRRHVFMNYKSVYCGCGQVHMNYNYKSVWWWGGKDHMNYNYYGYGWVHMMYKSVCSLCGKDHMKYINVYVECRWGFESRLNPSSHVNLLTNKYESHFRILYAREIII